MDAVATHPKKEGRKEGRHDPLERVMFGIRFAESREASEHDERRAHIADLLAHKGFPAHLMPGQFPGVPVGMVPRG